MTVQFSKEKQGLLAIAGHVGCGHIHSTDGQSQDDSAGLAVMLQLFREASGLSLKIQAVTTVGNEFTVILDSGGVGKATARRGITPDEQQLAQTLRGREVLNTQALVFEVFGRMYGQGILEAPCALQAAMANAALDSFRQKFPGQFLFSVEDVGDNMGYMLGCVLDIDGIPVSTLATVNATIGGIGPNEDLEGNSPHHAKETLINCLGMREIPTIIVEAKIFSILSHGLSQQIFAIRAHAEDDNPYVAKAVLAAAVEQGLAAQYFPSMGERVSGKLKKRQSKIAERIIKLGEELLRAESSATKVQIVAELAQAVSEDCGGISFMTNDFHNELGGAGMIRRTGALVNIVVPENFSAQVPLLTVEDTENYTRLVCHSIRYLAKHSIREAKNHIFSQKKHG